MNSVMRPIYVREPLNGILLPLTACLALQFLGCGHPDDSAASVQTETAALSGANHQSATSEALTGLYNAIAVRALASSSTVGDTDAVAKYRSATHFDNCFWQEGIDWINQNRASAVKSAIAFHASQSDADRAKVFRALGFVLHATQDFYAHSNWIEKHNFGEICTFESRPPDWVSATYADAGDPGGEQHCPVGTLHHDLWNKDSQGNPGFEEAFFDSKKATIDQVARFVTALNAASPGNSKDILIELGFSHISDTHAVADVFQIPNTNNIYFFFGEHYVRYNSVSDRADANYPKPIAGYWPGVWPSGFDAAVNWNNGKIYFFKGSEYVRYDIAADRVDPGYPMLISDHWPGLWPSGIDAAVNWNNGKVYFFKGSEYIRYDVAADRADWGYPLPISGHWPGLWSSGIDGASIFSGGSFSTNKAYFFKGSEYIRYDISADRADPDYPRSIHGNWSGL